MMNINKLRIIFVYVIVGFIIILNEKMYFNINNNSLNLITADYFIHFRKGSTLLLVLFTSNIYEQVMNFYYSSIQKFNINNVIFISLDFIGYNLVKNKIKYVFMSNYNHSISEHIDYNTPLYWKIVYSKTDYVKTFLDNNYNIILCDTDLIFFKDPRKYMINYNTDLVTSCDHNCPVMNSGF